MTNMSRIDDMFPSASFHYDGYDYTISDFVNGKVKCEREDGAIVYLAGNTEPDKWEPRSFKSWFHNGVRALTP